MQYLDIASFEEVLGALHLIVVTLLILPCLPLLLRLLSSLQQWPVLDSYAACSMACVVGIQKLVTRSRLSAYAEFWVLLCTQLVSMVVHATQSCQIMPAQAGAVEALC